MKVLDKVISSKNGTMVFKSYQVNNNKKALIIALALSWDKAYKLHRTVLNENLSDNSFYYKYSNKVLKFVSGKFYILKKIHGKRIFKLVSPFDYIDMFGGKINYTKVSNKVIAVNKLPDKEPIDMELAKALSYVLNKRISMADENLRITQQLKIPTNVKNRFTKHTEFILDNEEVATGKQIFKFMWEPESGEFLMGVYPENHKTIKYFGNHDFWHYLRGIYLKDRGEILFRPYWNPKLTPQFDRNLSLKVQEAMKRILQRQGGSAARAIKYVFDVTNKSLQEDYGQQWVW